MGKSFSKRINWPGVSLIVGSSLLLLFFQNCGKSGAGSDDMASLLSDSPEVKKFKAAGFPFEVNVNQIAYMTCPAAGNSKGVGEDIDNPFFTFRVGAFDNRSLANRFPVPFNQNAATLTDPERTNRLVAGVGLNKEFVASLKTSFNSRFSAGTPEDNDRLLRDAVMNSNYKYQLSSGLVLRKRITSQGFAWSQTHAKPIMAPLTSKNVANQLVATRDLGVNTDREKIFEMTGVNGDQRSLISSIGVPKTEAERDRLRQNFMSYEFVVGFTRPEFAGDVFMLESPTGENNDGFFGKTYRMTTTNLWPGRIDRKIDDATGAVISTANNYSIYSEFLSGIQEVETTTTGADRITSTTEGQQWSCFSLMVVRDVDRRDTVSSSSGNRVIDPGDYEDSVNSGRRVCNLWGPTPQDCKNKLKYYNYRPTPTDPLIPGVKVACPIQEVGNPTRHGSLNSQLAGGTEAMRLEIARRFLPADLWDINTNPEYMCAVPKAAAAAYGSCYMAKDNDASKYIMYTQTGSELGKDVTCGIDPLTGTLQKECPAFVSVCYRTY